MVWSEKDADDLPEGVELYSGQLEGLAETGARLAGDREVWVLGGAKTVNAFISCGFIHRYEIFVIPTLLGNGIRLFGDGSDEPDLLKLESVQPFANGVVQLVYENR
ncbi:MAG: dihydrofolate reductase family protein [bacterium]|nr:dihydrofolate reductase family protein [bacterium]